MAIEAGNVVWNITADLKPLNQALGDSEKAVQSSMGNILKIGQQIGVAFTAIGAGITAAFGVAVNAAMDYGGAIQDAATKTGIGAEELQKLKFGAEQSGVSFEGLQGAIIKMSKNIQEARDSASDFAEKGAAKAAKENENLEQKCIKAAEAAMKQRRALNEMTASGTASAEQIAKQTQKVNELSEKSVALERAFLGLDGAQRKTAEATGTQVEAFAKLGINLQSLQSLSPDQQFMRIADALSRVQDPALKTALAMDLFGRAGAQLIPFLNEGATGMAALGQKAQELGLVMSGDAIAQAEAFGDQWESLKAQFQMVAIQIGSALIPALMEMMPAIQATVASVINWVQQNPQLVTTIATVVGAIGAVMMVLGPLLIMLPGIVMAFSAIAAIVPVVGGVLLAIAAPVAAVIAVIGLLVAVGYTMYNEWENIVKLMQELWEGFKDILETVWDGIVMFLETAVGLALQPFLFFIDTVTMAWEGLMATIDIVVGAFEYAWDAIAGGFEWLGNQLASLWDWINGLVASGVQGIIDAVNYLTNLFGIGDVFSTGSGEGTEGRALGGPVSSGVPYIVGEKGQELFVPEQDGRIVPAHQTAQMMGGGGPTNITINGYNRDPRSLADEISRVLYSKQIAFGMS